MRGKAQLDVLRLLQGRECRGPGWVHDVSEECDPIWTAHQDVGFCFGVKRLKISVKTALPPVSWCAVHPESCVAYCKQKDYFHAGVEYGSECFCGNSYGRYGKANNCDMNCAGNPNQKGGGCYWAISTYELRQSDLEFIKSGFLLIKEMKLFLLGKTEQIRMQFTERVIRVKSPTTKWRVKFRLKPEN